MSTQIPSYELRRESYTVVRKRPSGQVAQSLREAGPLFLKRVIDVLGASFLLVLALPAGLLIALAIVLETRGPVFFRHSRIGKGNSIFGLLKFRSMVTDADRVLARHLAAHPDHRAEWEERHKLKADPRVTQVGRVLRRFSLDELPQLINVLRGEMSLVGPRPIVEQEIPKYGAAFSLYTQVAPGLTGPWQVSDRSQITYRERVRLDSHYIQHRTLGQELWILLKTVRVVLKGHGTY